MAKSHQEEVIDILKKNGRINNEILLEKFRTLFTEEEYILLEEAFTNMISEWY